MVLLWFGSAATDQPCFCTRWIAHLILSWAWVSYVYQMLWTYRANQYKRITSTSWTPAQTLYRMSNRMPNSLVLAMFNYSGAHLVCFNCDHGYAWMVRRLVAIRFGELWERYNFDRGCRSSVLRIGSTSSCSWSASGTWRFVQDLGAAAVMPILLRLLWPYFTATLEPDARNSCVTLRAFPNRHRLFDGLHGCFMLLQQLILWSTCMYGHTWQKQCLWWKIY